MADPKGFLKVPRETPTRRPVPLRLMDWREVYEAFPDTELEGQASQPISSPLTRAVLACEVARGFIIRRWIITMTSRRRAGALFQRPPATPVPANLASRRNRLHARRTHFREKQMRN